MKQIHHLTAVEKHLGDGELLCAHSKVTWKTLFTVFVLYNGQAVLLMPDRGFQVIFECAHIFSSPARCFPTAVKWCVLHQHKILVPTHDFQHTTKNVQTQSSLRRVENHVEELKHYCDANTTFDSC